MIVTNVTLNLLIIVVTLLSIIPYLRSTAIDVARERAMMHRMASISLPGPSKNLGFSVHSSGLSSGNIRKGTKGQFQLPPPPDGLLVQQGDKIYHRREWDAAPVVLEDFKLVFFTTAKVGCTVWKQLFRRIMGYQDWKETNGKRMLPWNPDYNGLKYLYDYNRTYASHMMTDPSWTRAIFVRDPKERFLSAYLDKVVQNPFFTNHYCCPAKRNCASPETTFDEFYELVQTCDNGHWYPQSRRMEAKYFPYLNFVGHMDTIEKDAKSLLLLIGAWQDYGSSGWGENDNESIFQPHHEAQHATRAQERLRSYYTPQMEAKVEDYCYMDYQIPYLELNRTSIFATDKEES